MRARVVRLRRPARAGARSLAPTALAVMALAVMALAPATPAAAQSAPHADLPVLRPELLALTCPARGFGPDAPGAADAPTEPAALEPAEPPRPLTPEEAAARARRQAYRELLPLYLARLPAEPDGALLMPVEGVRVSQVANTFGAARGGGRDHHGQDIFAPRGTPVRSATSGIVFEISDRFTGGRGVMILGPGGARYFYTHLDAYADGLREGMAVGSDTVIGYVGNDGNASTTPAHLHFGAYGFDAGRCRHRPFDPLPLMIDRQ